MRVDRCRGTEHTGSPSREIHEALEGLDGRAMAMHGGQAAIGTTMRVKGYRGVRQ